MVTRTWTPSQVVRSLRIALTGSRGRARAETVLKAFGRAVVFGASRAPSSAAMLQRCVDSELARDIRGSYFFTVQSRSAGFTADSTLGFNRVNSWWRRRAKALAVPCASEI